MGMDESVLSDAAITHDLNFATEAIVCGISMGELTPVVSETLAEARDCPNECQLRNIVPRLLEQIQHPVLQKKLVSTMPCRSPLTASLQRYLALAFLLYPVTLDVPLTDPTLTKLIHEHLKSSPHFAITKETDYSCLAARMSLLDIAIGPGFGTVPYHPLVDISVSQLSSEALRKNTPKTEEDKAFNQSIDTLAWHAKFISDNIVETGAMGDFTRVDAKDASERLSHRLESVVRIGGRVRKGIFDGEDKQQAMLAPFLSK
jgi:hypothetical protein